MPRLFASLSPFLMASWTCVAFAQNGDPAAGQALARTWCANCHELGAKVPPSADDAVPQFRDIARMPSTTSMALRAFLQTPHANMPDYHLTRRELNDIVSYILSLRDE